MRRPLLLVAAVALALPLLAACGDSDDTSSTPTTTPTASATATPTATQADCVPKAKAKVPAANDEFGEAPDIAKPVGEPPCELVVKDLQVGKGKAVSDTATAYAWNYEGVSWSTGGIFDSSFERGQPATFALNQVIPGWTEGLQGMKPGGRRMLVIPPDQAYGANPPAGSGIGVNDTLVFVVDLVGPAGATN